MKRTQLSKKTIKKPTQNRSRGTVNAILTATTHILVKSGWENLTTNNIAKRAGVSIGSLYQYFPNKSLIVQELIEQMFTEEDRIIACLLESIEDLDIESAIQKFVIALINIHMKNPELRKILYEITPLVGKSDRMRKHQDLSIQQLIDFLNRKNLKLRNGNMNVTVFILQHAVDAVIIAAINKNSNLLNQSIFIDELVQLISQRLLQ